MISVEQAKKAAKSIEFTGPITSIGVGYEDDYNGFYVRVGVKRPLVEGESIPEEIDGVTVLVHVTGQIVAQEDDTEPSTVDQNSA